MKESGIYRLEQKLYLVWASSNGTEGSRATFIKIRIVGNSVSSFTSCFAASPITILSIEWKTVWIMPTTKHLVWARTWLAVWSWPWAWTRCSVFIVSTCSHIKSTIPSSNMRLVKLRKQVWKLVCKFFLAFTLVILAEVWSVSLTLKTLIKVFISVDLSVSIKWPLDGSNYGHDLENQAVW